MAGKIKLSLRKKPLVKFCLPTRRRNQMRKPMTLEDYLGEEEEQQQSATEVATTKIGQRNNPTVPTSVFFSWPKKKHSPPDVTWAFARCLVSGNNT